MEGVGVSVVVPAFNAERTLEETLASVRAQTFRDLDIIVVDDGSADGTARIAMRNADEDPRIRLIRQANAGVAAARNAGVAAARGEYVAFIDADDVWMAAKIERQLDRFARSGPRVALVYAWFALIDARSRVIKRGRRIWHEGDVLAALAYYNFIGNGSSPLIRRAAIEEVGGFDSTLRMRGGQGCEDWKLYFEIAERHHFAVVPEVLTGYRWLPENMSADVLQMLRSRDLVIGDVRPRHPELAEQFRSGRNRMSRMLLHRALRQGDAAQVLALLGEMARHDRPFMLKALALLPAAALLFMSRHRIAGSVRSIVRPQGENSFGPAAS